MLEKCRDQESLRTTQIQDAKDLAYQIEKQRAQIVKAEADELQADEKDFRRVK